MCSASPVHCTTHASLADFGSTQQLHKDTRKRCYMRCRGVAARVWRKPQGGAERQARNAGELAKKASGCERPLFRMDISSGSKFMGMIVVLRICVVLPQYCGKEAGAGELRTHAHRHTRGPPIVPQSCHISGHDEQFDKAREQHPRQRCDHEVERP